MFCDNIDKLLEADVIKSAQSEGINSIALDTKKDSTHWFYLTERRVDTVTVPNNYPLLRMQDVFEILVRAKGITALDPLWKIFKMPTKRKGVYKTKLNSCPGTKHLTPMPFCQQNAPFFVSTRFEYYVIWTWKGKCLV